MFSVQDTRTSEAPATDAEIAADQAELEALVSEQWEVERIAAEAKYDALESVKSFPLTPTVESEQELWVVHTVGFRSIAPHQDHIVAIYARDESGWQEVAALKLTDPQGEIEAAEYAIPDYLGEEAVRQVFVEPKNIWLEVQGGAGAHSSTYHVLSYADGKLSIEVATFNFSPGSGKVVDLNGDGFLEVQLDSGDPYVFCYGCGVKMVDYAVMIWDGADFVRIILSPLPEDAPAEVRQANDQAIELAEAGLWKDALATINTIDGTLEAAWPELAWNALYIRLNAEARRVALEWTAYPLLSQLFYGDYAAALEIMRAYTPEELFSDNSPLVVGTVAESYPDWLSTRLITTAERALAVQPDLGEAYFIRAWGNFLFERESRSIILDVAHAAVLLPNDEFVRASFDHMRSVQ